MLASVEAQSLQDPSAQEQIAQVTFSPHIVTDFQPEIISLGKAKWYNDTQIDVVGKVVGRRFDGLSDTFGGGKRIVATEFFETSGETDPLFYFGTPHKGLSEHFEMERKNYIPFEQAEHMQFSSVKEEEKKPEEHVVYQSPDSPQASQAA